MHLHDFYLKSDDASPLQRKRDTTIPRSTAKTGPDYIRAFTAGGIRP